MELHNKHFSISIGLEQPDQLIGCDIVHNPLGIDLIQDYSMAHTIHIKNHNGITTKIALLDRIGSNSEHCAVLTDDSLTFVLFDAIVQIDIHSGLIIRCVECDNIGGLFEIHLFENCYILYGECSIFRYDLDFNRIWEFRARDILVSNAGSKSFWIDSGNIHCLDWLDWHYVLDFDGNIISEQHISETL